jgi:hypothetical protein
MIAVYLCGWPWQDSDVESFIAHNDAVPDDIAEPPHIERVQVGG